MKTSLKILIPTIISLCSLLSVSGQNNPVWIKSINAFPDSALMFPVRTVLDGNSNVFVLSTYYLEDDLWNVTTKIYVRKFNENGVKLWERIIDHDGLGNSRGTDLVVDESGNCYVAGWYNNGNQLVLVKLRADGSVSWEQNSTQAFTSGYFDKLIYKNNRLYAGGTGIAVFNPAGVEQWYIKHGVFQIAVDNSGQLIASGSDNDNHTVFRFDSVGVRNLADSSIFYASSIAVDAENNFYLLTGSQQYELVKYSSAGSFEWSVTEFPQTPPFGDIGLEVVCDQDNNVWAIGLADSLFKFDPSGNKIWQKPMFNLDNYTLSVKKGVDNQILVAGTTYLGNENQIKVSSFNLLGNQNWTTSYNVNNNGQEFLVDMAIDNSGVYLLANDEARGMLLKFSFPGGSSPNDLNQVCVDSVWYEPGTSNRINVRLFNGSSNDINYPSIQIISPSGDTIGNPENNVYYFAHPQNSYLVYPDSITQNGITDFSNYRFAVSEWFDDTTIAITWCAVTGLNPIYINSEFVVYPNPFKEQLNISIANQSTSAMVFRLFNSLGQLVHNEAFVNATTVKTNLKSGVYFYTIVRDGQLLKSGKLIAE